MLPLPKARFFTLSTPGNILDNAEIKFIMELSLKPYLPQNKLYIILAPCFALLLNQLD